MPTRDDSACDASQSTVRHEDVLEPMIHAKDLEMPESEGRAVAVVVEVIGTIMALLSHFARLRLDGAERDDLGDGSQAPLLRDYRITDAPTLVESMSMSGIETRRG